MADLSGKKLGPYSVMERIGLGGMATVYKAYHEAMDRYVAIKVLSHDHPEFLKRFDREAKTVAKLQHPHILPVFDYGEYERVSYLVMPYIASGSLKEYIRQGPPLNLDEIARIFTQLCEALDYAHNAGVLHRDIKPDNVMFDDNGNVLLADFGLTRLMESDIDEGLTGSGIVGTPFYLSPEQAQEQPLDARSDIYSLGIMLYEMVTGRVPFIANTAVNVILSHVNDTPEKPKKFRSDLPQAAEEVILKALEKQPKNRWKSAGAMAREFRQALDDEYRQSVDMPVISNEKTQNNRWVFGLMAIVIIFIIGGMIFMSQNNQSTTNDGVTPSPSVTETVERISATETAESTEEAVLVEETVETTADVVSSSLSADKQAVKSSSTPTDTPTSQQAAPIPQPTDVPVQPTSESSGGDVVPDIVPTAPNIVPTIGIG